MKNQIKKYLDRRSVLVHMGDVNDGTLIMTLKLSPPKEISKMFGIGYNEAQSLYFDYLRETSGYVVLKCSTETTFYKDGKIHLDSGPARTYVYGRKEWIQHDKYHRVGGPAIIHPNGQKEWLQNGELHREDGPAYISPNGTKEWWLNGKKIK